MDLSKVHIITNRYTDVRLVSLQTWRSADEVSPRDHGGPYAVLQDGYDPKDPTVTPDEFVLAKSGEWVSTSIFFRLPNEVRRQKFIFGTAAEVVDLLSRLTGEARTLCSEGEVEASEHVDDELSQAVRTGTTAQTPTLHNPPT